jgi:phosphatidylethanolamine/phosphatidyl-N-methylethanolamine N-methyltransferase
VNWRNLELGLGVFKSRWCKYWIDFLLKKGGNVELYEFYEKYYRHTTESWIVKKNHSYSHRMLERGVKGNFDNVIELGAGNGEHFPFVRHNFKTYLMSDLRNETKFVSEDQRVRFESFDAAEIPYDGDSFQRVISTCLLHHVKDVRRTLEEMRRVVTHRGLVSVNIAADPGLLYRLIWNATSGRRLRNQGLKFPKSVHYQEHRGHFIGIHEIALDVFENDSITLKYYPFTFIPTHQANIFAVMQVRVNKLSKIDRIG